MSGLSHCGVGCRASFVIPGDETDEGTDDGTDDGTATDQNDPALEAGDYGPTAASSGAAERSCEERTRVLVFSQETAKRGAQRSATASQLQRFAFFVGLE